MYFKKPNRSSLQTAENVATGENIYGAFMECSDTSEWFSWTEAYIYQSIKDKMANIYL